MAKKLSKKARIDKLFKEFAVDYNDIWSILENIEKEQKNLADAISVQDDYFDILYDDIILILEEKDGD